MMEKLLHSEMNVNKNKFKMSFLTDINNINVDGFYIGEDGIVYGQIGGISTDSLSNESCLAINMFFTDKCYWKENVTGYNDVDMILKQQENININYNEECSYSLEFDFLLFIDQSNLNNLNIGSNLNDFKYYVTFSKNGTHTYLKEIDGRDLLSKFTDDNESALYVDGNFTQIKNRLETFLGVQINNSKFRSNWNKFNIQLTYSDIMNINGSAIGFELVKPFDGIHLKIDNIEIKQECEKIITKTKIFNNNPSFEFNRLIDNKKSWVISDLNRDYNKFYRDTKYNIEDDREVLNSKELDLNISYNNSIETMFYEMIKENPLQITNLITNNPIFDEFDINSESLDTLSEFLLYFVGQFCNPRSYRTAHTNVLTSFLTYKIANLSSITFENLTPIVTKIDTYWLDIISQFVPSTSIWESNIVLGNNNFNYDKFRYRKYSLVDLSPYSIGDTIYVDSELNNNVVFDVTKTLINFSMGSEFVGTFEYDELPKPQHLFYYINGYIGENDMCGTTPSPLRGGFVFNFTVGSTMYTDEDGTINFVPIDADLYYLLIFGGVSYSVKFNENGVILSIVNLTGCTPNPEMVRLFNVTHETSYAACSAELGDFTNVYTDIFYLSHRLFTDINLTNVVNVPNPSRYYNAIYNGIRYVIKLDINSVIVEMDECSDAIVPQVPRSFNANGGQFLLNGSIYGDDNSVNQYEIQYTLNNVTNWNNLFVNRTGSNTSWNQNNVQAGVYNLRCRAYNPQGNFSSWITVNNVTVTGVSEIVIREPETTDPCESFPPIRGIDRSGFIPVKNIELIKTGIPIFSNSQMTERFVPINQSGRVLIGDLLGDKLVNTNISQIGEVITINPCSIRPIPIDVVLTPTPIADNGCVEFVSGTKVGVWNNNGFKIGSRFFTNESLTEPLNLSSFEGQYLIGKLDSEAVPRSMLIRNGAISELALPCNNSDKKFIKINPNSIDISPRNSCELGGRNLSTFNKNLYYDGVFNKGTVLYNDSNLTEIYQLEQTSSISFINEGSSVINNLRIRNGEVLDFYPCSKLQNRSEVILNETVFESTELACMSNNFVNSKALYSTEIGTGVKLFEDIDLTQQFKASGNFSTIINRTKSYITLEVGTIINYKPC